MLILFASSASAAITSIQPTNIFPDSEVRFRDTEVVVELTSDSTETTDVEFWIQKPDETWFQVGTQTGVNVRSGNPRTINFAIESDNLDQYGNYDFKVNETNSGLSRTVQTELVPRPNIELSNPTNIRINGNQFTYFNLDINTFIGEKIPLDELEPGNLTIYRIDDNPNTPNTVEKVVEEQQLLTTDTESGDLEAYINTTELPLGSYELRADANITSCDVCEVYVTTTSDVININNDYAQDVYDEKWGSLEASDIESDTDTILSDKWGSGSANLLEEDVENAETNIINNLGNIESDLDDSTMPFVLAILVLQLVTLAIALK